MTRKTCVVCGFRHWQARDECDTCRHKRNQHSTAEPKKVAQTFEKASMKVAKNVAAREKRETRKK